MEISRRKLNTGLAVTGAVWTCSRAQAETQNIGMFEFDHWNGPKLNIHYVEPITLKSDAPIVIVMHGASRSPGRYRDSWIDLSQEYGFAVYAPEFTKKTFPGSKNYNLGRLHKKNRRPFDAIEPIFDFVKARRGLTRETYYIFGHSAGAQFVHRYLYFKPNARIEMAFSANAGWYTLPNQSQAWPYGLANAPVSAASPTEIFSKRLVLLLGDKDNDPQSNLLRRTPEAMLQGSHRFERGLYFLKTAKADAEKLGVPLNWHYKIVKGVAHDNRGVALAAAPIIAADKA